MWMQHFFAHFDASLVHDIGFPLRSGILILLFYICAKIVCVHNIAHAHERTMHSLFFFFFFLQRSI